MRLNFEQPHFLFIALSITIQQKQEASAKSDLLKTANGEIGVELSSESCVLDYDQLKKGLKILKSSYNSFDIQDLEAALVHPEIISASISCQIPASNSH